MTQRKEKALQALLTHPTKKAAAEAAGVSDETLRTYLKDPEFLSAYKHAAAGVMDAATRQLQQTLTVAIERLGKILADDGKKTADHLTAIRTALEYSVRFTEFNDVLKELEGECTMTD